MSKTLKRVLVTGASLLMFASVGAGTASSIHANSAKSKINFAIKTNDLTTMNSTFRKVTRIGNHNYRIRRFRGNKCEIKGEGVGTPYINGHKIHGYNKALRILKHSSYRHYRKHTRKRYRKSRKHARKHLGRHSYRRPVLLVRNNS